MKRILLLGLMLISANSWAQDDQIIVDGGVGVFHSAEKGLSETKMLTVGIQEDFWGPLKMRGVTGGWIDVSSPSKSSSGLVSGQLGFEVNNGGWVGGIFSGPTIITNTDELLGGHFQFMDDLHLGIQDCHSNYIGVFYRHLSSAGLEMPNIGRDVVGVEIRF